MKFIDEATITVSSGDGGAGCVSFRREKFIPRGGPDGGDGGKGGDVILKTTSGKNTLYEFGFKRYFKAKNGGRGQGNRRAGRNGGDVVIEIPAGTVVTDAETGEILKDFVKARETWIAVSGGRGGQGNKRFASSTHRTPRFAQPGEPGQTLTLKLELKLLADVGIVGLPNAGKSTLIRAISSATPKTADYPFTTLSPILGAVPTDTGESFVAADIPGLIEGAHQGVGLGDRFLRHIERTKILIHLIDAFSIDPDNPMSVYETIDRELGLYGEGQISEKPRIVVMNKMDLSGAAEATGLFREKAGDMKIMEISALAGDGVEELKSEILRMLEQ